MKAIIYHNPMCSKSRQTVDILKEKGVEFGVVEYLKSPPTKTELEEILEKLGKKPEEIIRKGEGIYKEFYAGKEFLDTELIDILVKNPALIERPIVVMGDKAAIGRPPENVLEIL